MLAIDMKNITKRFGAVCANNKINLRVKKGEIHCLLGENGAGKTTLMKILFGLYKQDDGEIFINDKLAKIDNPNDAYSLGLGMVHQHFMLIKNMTVLENIVLGHEHGKLRLDNKKAYDEVQKISEKYNFNLDLNMLVSELSVGAMQRVEILKTVYRGAEIIIFDEPTAVLTPQEVESLLEIFEEFRAEGKTIIFITHKLNETMKVSDTITVLRNGMDVAIIDKTQTTAQNLASLMVGREVDFGAKKNKQNLGKIVLEIKDLKLLPQASANINFNIRAGEIFGIAGVDGNGQQEIEEAIMGLSKPSKQNNNILFCGANINNFTTKQRRSAGIAYVPSDRFKRAIVKSFSIEENYFLGNQYREKYCSKTGIIKFKTLKEHSLKLIKEFEIKTGGLWQTIDSLSGGNQQKMVLSREVSEDPALIIVAQPVRGLDIGAIEYVHTQLLKLRDLGKAILLISTELSEITKLSDRIGVLYKGEFMDIRNANEFDAQEIGLLMAGRKNEKTNKGESNNE